MRGPSAPHLDVFMQALSRMADTLPADLRDQSVAELRRRWESPTDRARIVKGFTPVAQAAAPMLLEIQEAARAFREALAQAERGLAHARQCLGRVRVHVQDVAALAERVPHLAAQYCLPYRRQMEKELAEWRLRPLSAVEQWEFLVTSVLLTSPLERVRGLRPPLEDLALLSDRLDVAVAVLYHRHPELCTSARRDTSLPEDRKEVPGEVLVVLREEVLPSIHRRLQAITPREARRALQELLSRQYLVASVCRDLQRRRWQAARRAGHPRRQLPEEPRDLAAEADLVAAVDTASLESVLADYLARSDRPELDAKIVAAIHVGRAMARLAAETGVPARTLSYRRQGLLRHCQQELGLE